MIYFMHIGFDGSGYRGWQWQPNVVSVQGTIEKVFEKIFKRRITVFGCGRTDAGVHATQYMMHVDLEEESFDYDLKYRLNKNLPDDIAIYDIVNVVDGSHCRFDATWRTYDYFMHFYKDAFISKYSSQYEFEKELDFEAMHGATALLTQYNDFRGVCKKPDDHNHTRCNVTHAKLYVSDDKRRLRFSITSNRFLRGMIRLCIYYLLEVGTGRLSVKSFENILANQIESQNLKPAFPNGLYLSHIQYPYLDIEPQSAYYSFLTTGLS